MLESSLINVMKLLLVLVLMCTGLVTASDGQCPTDLPNTSAMSLFLETCYQFVTEERYWNDASDYCIQYGGRLVKINDAETNEFIVGVLNGLWWRNRGVWIGLHDRHSELHWQWIGNTRYSDERATWFNWAHGHPKAFLHRFRDCVRMGRNGGQWLWHETPCSSLNWKYRFICQYEMTATSSTSQRPTTSTTLSVDIIDNKSSRDDWQEPDTDERRRHKTSSLLSTITSSSSRPLSTTDSANNNVIYDYVMADSAQDLRQPTNSNSWVIVVVCISTSCIVLLVFVLLWRRRTDRRLRLVAVATDEKEVKSISLTSDLMASKRAKSNVYESEPRASAKVKEGHTDTEETLGSEYCPMNGTTDYYLEPRCEQPYLAMGYETGVSQHCYGNTENRADCGMMGYDVPAPVHIYSEIPSNDDDVDDEGNHIYEFLDDHDKPQ